MELNELTLDYLIAKPVWVRLLALLGLFLIILLLAYVGLIKPRLAQLTILREQQEGLKISYQRQQDRASKLAAYQKEIESMQGMERAMLAQLTSVDEFSHLLATIAKLGAQNGLEMNLVKPAPENKQELYTAMPVNISVTGDYHHLVLFLSGIAALKKIVSLDDISIRSSENSTSLLMKLQATAYRYSGDKVTKVDNGALPELISLVPTAYTAIRQGNPFTLPVMQVSGFRDPLASYALEALQMVGTVEKGGKLWALVATEDKMIFWVAVGMPLGQLEGKVVAIHSRQMDIVQTLQNGVKKEVSLKMQSE